MAIVAAAALVPGGATTVTGLALVLLLVAVWVSVNIWQHGSRWVVASPVFLMGWVALVPFALVPLLAPESWLWTREVTAAAWAGGGELAMRLTLGAAASCLIGALALSRIGRAMPQAQAPHMGLAAGIIIALVTAGFCTAYSFWHGTGELAGILGGELSRQVLGAVPIAAATVLVLLSLGMARQPALALPVLIVLIAFTLALVSHATVKLVILTGGVALLAHLAFARRPLIKFLVMGVVLGVTVIIAFYSVFAGRYLSVVRDNVSGSPVPVLIRAVEIKLGERFAVTQMCFARVVERHWDATEGFGLYYAGALIPRAVWPDKPSLSTGNQIGSDYCLVGTYSGDPYSSMSVTVLGEPIMVAGRMGLAAALPALVVLLIGIPAVLARFPVAGVPVIVGTAPWLMDFDQQFAMYVALGVKALIIAVVTTALCLTFSRLLDRR